MQSESAESLSGKPPDVQTKTASLFAKIKNRSIVGSDVINKVFGCRRPFDPSKASEGETQGKKKKAAFPAKKGKSCKKTVTMMKKRGQWKVSLMTTLLLQFLIDLLNSSCRCQRVVVGSFWSSKVGLKL